MKTSDFDFPYPPELVAQNPAKERDGSRLLVLNKKSGQMEHRHFFDIVEYLKPGDLLVLNNTKVIPANLAGLKEGGTARIEVLLASRLSDKVWECLVKPGQRLKVGSRVIFGGGELVGRILEKKPEGEQIVEFEYEGDFQQLINKLGEIPLPPYIRSTATDRYQTVYARAAGASAAPTAGLHFTPELLDKVKAKKVKIAWVTLHTGLATFKPVWAEDLEDHVMHQEAYSVPASTIKAVKKAKRIIAVGTTVTRTLETLALKRNVGQGFTCPERGRGMPCRGVLGKTDLFIFPGYKFKVVDGLITNFHFPRSTLVMLVSAFAGKGLIDRAYQEAIKQKYRLFSFGDAMFIS